MTDTQRALTAEAKLTDLAHKHEAALRTLDDVDDALKYIINNLPSPDEFDDLRASAEAARADIKPVLEGFDPLPTRAEIDRNGRAALAAIDGLDKAHRSTIFHLRILAITGWIAAAGLAVVLVFVLGGK
jgi:hypothetical protein